MVLRAAVMPGERLVLRFSDDGCGMSAEVLDHVFDPFYTTKLGKGGSGLGMHIVYNLTTQVLGGQIQVESKPAHGTQWTLDIPVIAP